MNLEALTVGIGILTLFATILIATISGTAAILWRIARIDKEKVDWTACQHLRETCPCRQEIKELKTTINNKEKIA
jgi:hypothetical protein